MRDGGEEGSWLVRIALIKLVVFAIERSARSVCRGCRSTTKSGPMIASASQGSLERSEVKRVELLFVGGTESVTHRTGDIVN